MDFTVEMKYMFLIYSDETSELTTEELAFITKGHSEVMNDAAEKGVLVNAEPLKSTRFATTLRKENGKRIITDGPFAESKEQLVGYYILDLASIDEALEWASRIPAGAQGREGAIEIRPLPGVPAAMLKKSST